MEAGSFPAVRGSPAASDSPGKVTGGFGTFGL